MDVQEHQRPLLTIGGFTGSGDVISYDPASLDPSGNHDLAVRHVYPRDDFEDVWMTATGGIVYLIYPAGIALPPHTPGLPANW